MNTPRTLGRPRGIGERHLCLQLPFRRRGHEYSEQPQIHADTKQPRERDQHSRRSRYDSKQNERGLCRLEHDGHQHAQATHPRGGENLYPRRFDRHAQIRGECTGYAWSIRNHLSGEKTAWAWSLGGDQIVEAAQAIVDARNPRDAAREFGPRRAKRWMLNP